MKIKSQIPSFIKTGTKTKTFKNVLFVIKPSKEERGGSLSKRRNY